MLIIRLEEEIVKVDKLCMLRRRETECCIEHCRNLLKPWYVWDNVVYVYDKRMLLYCDRHRDYTLGHQTVSFKTQTDGYNRNLTEHNVTWVVHVLFVNLTRDLQRKSCDFRIKENETKTDKSKLIKAFSVLQYETIMWFPWQLLTV